MSVRNFRNIYCPTCDKDTLHIALKCTECGTVVVTGAQQYRESRKRIRRSPFRRIRIARNVAATRKVRHQAAVERHLEFEKAMVNSTPVGRRTVFGSGRERRRT